MKSSFFLILGFPLVAHANFADVPADHPNAEAITYVEEQGTVQGYPDGTFKPDANINRAEFTKIIVGAKFSSRARKNCDPFRMYAFSDASHRDWYAPFLCVAVQRNLIEGYPDGTFKPGGTINFVEAAKIIVVAEEGMDFDASGEQWFTAYVEYLRQKNAVPDSIVRNDQKLTRGEMAEIIWRLSDAFVSVHSSSSQTIEPVSCLPTEEQILTGVDMQQVRSTWLSWLNAARAENSLPAYTYNVQLNRTANIWSQFSAARQEMTHQRIGQTAYYDYPIITKWFSDLGVEFKNIYRVTYSENIGRGPYSCQVSDCTSQLLAAIRYTFDFYMAEENDDYRPHYNSVMNQYFTIIGMGITVGPDGNFYLTTHYGTEITSDPTEVCL